MIRLAHDLPEVAPQMKGMHGRNGSAVLSAVMQAQQERRKPERWSLGKGFDPVVLSPGRLIGVGGSPGLGKTALLCGWVFDALTHDRNLRALIANVEVKPELLTERELSRRSGTPLGLITDCVALVSPCADRLRQSVDELRGAADRLLFVERGDLAAVEQDAELFGARLVLIDYVQRFSPSGSCGRDAVARTDAVLSSLRVLANDRPSGGRCVLFAYALHRQAARYGGGMSGGRNTSEIEYAADQLFTLESRAGALVLKHHKNRHGPTPDVPLVWQPEICRFDPAPDHEATINQMEFEQELKL